MNFGGSASDAIYGVAKSGGRFDVREYFMRPTVIINIVAALLGIMTFRKISSSAYGDKGACIINEGSSVCGFMSFVSGFSILFALAMLTMEARFASLSSVKMRRRFVLAELTLCTGAAILYFLGFCYLINQWSETEAEKVPHGHTSGINAAAAFSFIQILLWLALSFLAYQKYKQGAGSAFGGGLDAGDLGGMPPYAATYPGAPGDQYQDPPFAGFATSPSRDTGGGGGGYQSGPY